jgi:hypothetical protein
MHHPESWSVSFEPETAEFVGFDLYLSPVAGEVHVILFDGLDPAIPANALLQEAATNFSQQIGAPEETESLTVAGAPALLLGAHRSDETGDWWLLEVAIAGVGRAWDVQLYAVPGTETKARETLDQFLATFAMAED